MATIRVKQVSYYRNNYNIPFDGWEESLYIEYEGALRAMRLKRLDVEVINIETGYTKIPEGVWTIQIAGVGEVQFHMKCYNSFPVKMYRTPDDFTANRSIDLCNCNNGRLYKFSEWVAECFGVMEDQLGKNVEKYVHDGRTQAIYRYRWNGTAPECVALEMPNKAYCDAEGWHFCEPCELPADTYPSREECQRASDLKVVEFEEDKPTPKKPIDKEHLLQETIALLSSDLYNTMYQSDHFGGWGDVCDAIIEYAKQFERELNWQEDDERDYMEELEAFENKIMKELNLID